MDKRVDVLIQKSIHHTITDNSRQYTMPYLKVNMHVDSAQQLPHFFFFNEIPSPSCTQPTQQYGRKMQNVDVSVHEGRDELTAMSEVCCLWFFCVAVGETRVI